MLDLNNDLKSRYAGIDAGYLQFLKQHDQIHERWLLEQTVYTSEARRGLLPMLPLADGNRVLDIGTGFGALALDLAALKSVQVDAVDVDSQVLDSANEIYQRVQEARHLQPGSHVAFSPGNVYELPFDDNTIDFVVARFVYQHIEEPWKATAEIKRVLKPGGFVCLIDIDDQFTITYPNENRSFDRLQEVFHQLQIRKGGDRFVGRKLATFMHEQGLTVVGSVVQPESYFTAAKDGDLGLELTTRRFRELRSEILEANLMTEDDFESSLAAFIRDMKDWHYHASGTVVVVGRK